HLLIETGRFEEALESLEWALTLDPDLVEVQYDRAVSLGNLRRFEECAAQADVVLRLEPGHEGAMYAKAEALRLLGRFPEAQDITERLLLAHPHDAAVHRQYTFILSAESGSSEVGLEDALRAATDWVDLSPDDSSA